MTPGTSHSGVQAPVNACNVRYLKPMASPPAARPALAALNGADSIAGWLPVPSPGCYPPKRTLRYASLVHRRLVRMYASSNASSSARVRGAVPLVTLHGRGTQVGG